MWKLPCGAFLILPAYTGRHVRSSRLLAVPLTLPLGTVKPPPTEVESSAPILGGCLAVHIPHHLQTMMRLLYTL